ncbi:MAG: TonB-dependent receptor [Candidatus Zixiibacteriota bacterium]
MGSYSKIIWFFLTVLFFVLFAFQLSFAQDKGILCGKVVDAETEKPVPGATVELKGTLFKTTTDKEGAFQFKDIPAGKYTVVVKEEGFTTAKLSDQQVFPKRTTFSNCPLMRKGREGKEEVFMIGGIVVTAERPIIQDVPETKTVIRSGEIEQSQATNLGDVLELVPGVEKTNRFGLEGAVYASVRGGDNFGSKIIVDGVPMSMNAYMQGGGTASGLDLRRVPAASLSSVEVIKGVPGVQYGDLAAGIIDVKSKVGKKPFRFKYSSNAKNREGNLDHGIEWGKSNLNYSLNYAYCFKDLKQTGVYVARDRFSRASGYLIFQSKLFDDKLETYNKVWALKTFDAKALTEEHALNDYDRGYMIQGKTRWTYTPKRELSYTFDSYVNFTRNKKHDETILQETGRPRIGQKTITGEEWLAGSKLELRYKLLRGETLHDFLVGLSMQYEGNFGPGFWWPPDSSYYFTDLGYTPYRFDDIPDRLTLSFYTSDTWSSKFLGKDFILTPGLRIDSYGIPKKSHNYFGLANSFFNLSPRISLLFKLNPTTQIRTDGGLNTKQPSIGQVFRPFRRNTSGGGIIHYFSNPKLKPYKQESYNFSIDKELSKKIGLSLNLYYKHIFDGITDREYPFNLPEIIRPPNPPDSTYMLNGNRSFSYTRGVEFTITANRIGDFNFETNITYTYAYSGSEGLLYNTTPDTSRNERFVYPSGNSWRKKVLIDYSIDYKTKPLGVWIKITVQQHPLDWLKDFSYVGVDPYNNVWKKYADVKWKKYDFWGEKIRWPKFVGDYWLFNLQLSKSLYWGSELSLRVNNFPDDWAYVYNPYDKLYTAKNNPLYFSFEFSTAFGK